MNGPETSPSFDGWRLTPTRTARLQIKAPIVAALCLWMVCLFLAAPLCYGQCPLHLPPKCQQISDELDNLVKEDKKSLQAEMQKATGQQKSAIANQIKNQMKISESQIAAKQKQLDSCIAANGLNNLSATLKGTLTILMDLDEKAGKPYNPYGNPYQDDNVSIQLTYQRWVRDQVVVNSVSTVRYWGDKFGPGLPYDLVNWHTMQQNSQFVSYCGEVNSKTGKLSVTLTLPVRLEWGVKQGQTKGNYSFGFSNLLIALSTDNSGGSRLDKQGKITLSGEGVFMDGYLNGHKCRMWIKGTLLPLPTH